MRNRGVHLVAAAIILGWGALLAAAVGSTASRERAPVTIVILPPDVKAEDAEARVAAELLCDRLAERLGDVAGIRVVDRTQIDRVLAEHALARKPAGPVLAYDAMVRVSVDALVPLPRVRLSVIDLSHGNVIGFTEQHWHIEMSPEALSEMVEACAVAAKALAAGPDGRLRVRIPGVVPVGDPVTPSARLEPLADRLQHTLEGLVSRTPSLQLVRHLEAATAKEESFLLLMGLSRLPGGRQFAPQADVTLELKLNEIDPVGKTFDETTLEIHFRPAREAADEWKVLRGTVAELDDLTVKVWEELSRQLTGVDPKAGLDYLKERAERRRQAQAELEKLHSIGAHRFPRVWNISGDFPLERRQQILRTAAAAAKLDPTSEEAAFISLKFHYLVQRFGAVRDKTRGPELMKPLLTETLGYLSRFKGPEARRAEALDIAHAAIHWVLAPEYARTHQTRDRLLSRLHKGLPPEWKHRASDPAMMDTIRQLVDLGVAVPLHVIANRWENGAGIQLVYENMIASGMAPDPCRRWRDRAVQLMEVKLLDAWEQGRLYVTSFRRTVPSLRCIAITYAVDEGHPDRARELLTDLMRTTPYTDWLHGSVRSNLVEQAERLGDVQLAAEVRRWARYRHHTQGVKPLRIQWPPARPREEGEPPLVKSRPVSSHVKSGDQTTRRGMKPIAETGDRMYVFFNSYSTPVAICADAAGRMATRFGYVRLAADGAPQGDGIVPLARPQVTQRSSVTDVEMVGDKVCVATGGAGILVYDPETDRWAHFAGKEGMPYLRVNHLQALDDHRLLGISLRFVYVIDLETGQITLKGKMDKADFSYHVWRAGERWSALCSSGVIEDILAPQPSVRPWPPFLPLGWEGTEGWCVRSRNVHLSMATVKGHRFVEFEDGLREIDAEGRTLRVWVMDGHLDIADPSRSRLIRRIAKHHRIPFPGDMRRMRLLGHDDSYLFFNNFKENITNDSSFSGLMCFDPEKDLWYGPVAIQTPEESRWGRFVGRQGIWCGYSWDPMVYAATADIIAAAKAAGRVASSEERKMQQQRMIDAAPPLDRAKYALSFNQLDEAKQRLGDILRADPKHAEALILMGWLHDEFCMNRTDEALQYYERAAALADNPSAALMGMYLQCESHLRKGNLVAAREICRNMLTRFKVADRYAMGLQGVVNHLTKEINATPSAATAGEP